MREKLIALALCLSLLLLPWTAAAEPRTEPPIDGSAAVLAEGAVLYRNVYWTGGDYRTENYIELAPGAALAPAVASRDPLCAVGSLAETAEELEARGLHTVAGVNGGFYNMSTGVPVGVIVRDGVLRGDDDGLTAVGFRRDGGAVIGRPRIWLWLTAGDESVDVLTLNHARGAGLALFTPDFAAETRAAGDGWNVVCFPDGPVPLSGAVTLTVEQLLPADGAVPIPEGRMILSLRGDTSAEAPYWLAALSPGDTLTLNVYSDAAWHDVDSAVTLLYPLIEDGAVADGLARYSGAEPRSAIGVKADGGVVLYTVDGRQSGYSVGAGLDAVARRLLELGCVAAGALDGGASTQLSAALPGDRALRQVNSPSGGAPRSVANYIVLTTAARPTGQAARLALYPLNIDALSGAEIPLTVKAVDENGYPADVPGDVRFTVSDGLGTVENGVFRATKAGNGTITVSAGELESAAIPLTVVESPDEIGLYGEVYGHLTKSLTLAPGQEVDLTARALANHVLLSSADEGFIWALEPAAGTVDGTGHLTPALSSGSGVLTVTAGETSERIPITVWSGVPFGDVPVTGEHFAAIQYVYDHQLFNGTSETVFDPDVVMNRGMLVTVLWRMNGAPEAENRPGFSDVASEDWYGPAVAWGAERGIINGYSETQFAPLDELTKEQIVTILHRYAGNPAAESGVSSADAGDVSAWAAAPMAWAAGLGLVDADGEGRLLPQAPMIRAAVAEVLMRFLSQ